MRAWIVRCVVVISCLIGCGSAFAGTKQCSKALGHIRATMQKGDLLAAKLLADQAVADACLIGCNDRQQVMLGQLREEVIGHMSPNS